MASSAIRDQHLANVRNLEQERTRSFDDFEEAAFRIGFDALGTVDDKMRAIQDRLGFFRTKANVAFSADNFSGARDALEEIGQLTQELNSLEGGAFSKQRQADLLALAEESQRLFAREIEEQQKLAAAADEAAKKIQEQFEAIKLREIGATDALEAFKEQLAAVDDTPIEQLKEQYAELTKEIKAATTAAGKLHIATLSGVTSNQDNFLATAMEAASSAPGFAQGGKNHDPRDNILALLRRGETVLTPEHSKALAPMLRQVGVPGFAQGGVAGFHGIQQSTRRFADLHNALRSSDRSSNLANMADALIQTKFRRQGTGFARVNQAPMQAEALQMLKDSIPGFAQGGGTTDNSVSVGDIHVNFTPSGNSERDVVDLGRRLRTEIRRGTISLNP